MFKEKIKEILEYTSESLNYKRGIELISDYIESLENIKEDKTYSRAELTAMIIDEEPQKRFYLSDKVISEIYYSEVGEIELIYTLELKETIYTCGMQLNGENIYW